MGGPTGLIGLTTYEIVTGDLTESTMDFIGSAYDPEIVAYSYELASATGL